MNFCAKIHKKLLENYERHVAAPIAERAKVAARYPLLHQPDPRVVALTEEQRISSVLAALEAENTTTTTPTTTSTSLMEFNVLIGYEGAETAASHAAAILDRGPPLYEGKPLFTGGRPRRRPRRPNVARGPNLALMRDELFATWKAQGQWEEAEAKYERLQAQRGGQDYSSPYEGGAHWRTGLDPDSDEHREALRALEALDEQREAPFQQQQAEAAAQLNNANAIRTSVQTLALNKSVHEWM
jgi:hypothetical protein